MLSRVTSNSLFLPYQLKCSVLHIFKMYLFYVCVFLCACVWNICNWSHERERESERVRERERGRVSEWESNRCISYVCVCESVGNGVCCVIVMILMTYLLFMKSSQFNCYSIRRRCFSCLELSVRFILMYWYIDVCCTSQQYILYMRCVMYFESSNFLLLFC